MTRRGKKAGESLLMTLAEAYTCMASFVWKECRRWAESGSRERPTARSLRALWASDMLRTGGMCQAEAEALEKRDFCAARLLVWGTDEKSHGSACPLTGELCYSSESPCSRIGEGDAEAARNMLLRGTYWPWSCKLLAEVAVADGLLEKEDVEEMRKARKEALEGSDWNFQGSPVEFKWSRREDG